ncbi:hypothetical protein ILUMI_21018 [Ignelater luminosus]|uniref:ATP synthase F(0) complex subunit e, mitochondrial n=1 Tax=Ignelater luminosus TaxID=2038154 RepID=A0A8K0CJN0_IGNLU|nr:hypothetical protein ILUMI_21018 [Ignelater luminosus]
MANLGTPLKVSPLIKLGRWSFLSFGIVYGVLNRGRILREEAIIRERKLKEKQIRDEKLAEEKKQMSGAQSPGTRRETYVDPTGARRKGVLISGSVYAG